MPSGIKNRRMPSAGCVICEKTLEQVGGGKRIIAQGLRGVVLTDKATGNGGCKNPSRTRFLNGENDQDGYLLVWGEPGMWTEASIERARQAFLDGERPWLCQICAIRQCSECGAPINYPMGSDILYDDGCSTHVPIFPFDPGCTNLNCKKYKEWDF